MEKEFTGVDGWPCDFSESTWGADLIRAVAGIPGGDRLDKETCISHARLLFAVAEGGRNAELPRNRPASMSATETELRKLVSLTEKLADHIDTLRQPAVSALYKEGADVFGILRSLRDLDIHAKEAFSEINIEENAIGAPKKIEALEVAYAAYKTFHYVSGKRPTYTTHIDTGEVSGPWPDFLGSVYRSLHIKASVPAQVRAVSEKSRSN